MREGLVNVPAGAFPAGGFNDKFCEAMKDLFGNTGSVDAYGHPVAADETPATIQARFEKFHAENPEVYAELVRLARIWKAAGKKRCGIRTLWENMRWHLELANASDEEFKLNDHYHSRYVRLICEQEPDLAGMFELRTLKSA